MKNLASTKKILLCLFGSLLVFAHLFASNTKATNKTDFYKSAINVGLRAPAVPLILSDPYLSIWSPFNKLNEGNSQHWTGEEHPLIGALRVDGKTYRFMGKDTPCLIPIIPIEEDNSWTGTYTFNKPSEKWMEIGFDDKDWRTGKSAFGTSDMPCIGTRWETKDIWLRRTFTITEDFSNETLILEYSHDDVFELYLNGERLVKTDYSWKNNVHLVLSDAQKKKLKKGKNIIAAHCHNTTGGGYVDFGLYKRIDYRGFDIEAYQQSVNVLPTQTFYTFTCGPVELDLVFTAPLLPTDLDLISTPINYISYRVRSTDKKEHDVQLYFETTPQLAVNNLSQHVTTEVLEKNGQIYLKTGTIEQPITKRTGDGVCIDWGYAYLTAGKSSDNSFNIGDYYEMKKAFVQTGDLLAAVPKGKLVSDLSKEIPVLAYADKLGKIGKEGKSGYLMIGYDDVYSIEYFFQRRMAYWKHDGQVDIFQAFERAINDYQSIMDKCRDFNKNLMADALKAGGKEYAELCALAYRHVIAAHKLLKDENGNLLFLSKENDSNGCINTVDLTYPSAPLFLLYNTELLKGMMNPIFHYSESGRWKKPFPAHDIGTYPIANGQVYGEDMPVEEGGNMMILAAAITMVEGNANYAIKHWETLTTWANYLVEKGLDPENQLCTDDFAGHLAHNANLSVKAILGIAGYGYMAKMAGKDKEANLYIQTARTMAEKWKFLAMDGDHYKLAFDKPGTWSQKYNMIWDIMFDWGIFDPSIPKTEFSHYLKVQNKYGLPLDSRREYTKSDWVLWTACMALDRDGFDKIVQPIYKYANETSTRVPLSDWHETVTGKRTGFKARSVIGAYYMKILFDKVKNNELKK